MYKICGKNTIDGIEEFDILEVRDTELLGIDPILQEGINKVPSLSFALPVTNVNYDKVKKLETEIIVIDLNGDVEIFRGRCISNESDFYNTKKCVCEGALAYLLDSKQPPYLHTGSLSVFIKMLLDEHNSKVNDKQKVYVGNITVTDPNDYMRRESEKDYDPPLNIIQDKVVESYGGLLQIRRTNGLNYLDYLKDYPICDQVARFGENITDLIKYAKAEDVRTVIIPLGAEDDNGNRLKITSVNDGKDYLADQALVDIYGWIEDVIIWDDVTVAANLKTKASEYLDECKNMSLTINLNAIDARLLGLDVRRTKPGMMVKVVSSVHGLDTYFLCTEKSTNLLSPDKDKITLGSEVKTYTETVNRGNKDTSEKIKVVDKTIAQEIQDRKDNFAEVMNNAGGLWETEVEQDDGSTIRYLHNKLKMADSDILIVINAVGVGVSADGGTSWYGMQVDGDMITNILSAEGINANWIRVGTLNADLIRAGKIRSINFAENKSGTEFDINTGIITSYYYNPYNAHYYRMRIEKTSVSVTDLSNNNRASMSLEDISYSDHEKGKYAYMGAQGFYLANISNGGQIYNLYRMTQEGTVFNDGKKGVTATVTLDDGSRFEFRNGICVGGWSSGSGMF